MKTNNYIKIFMLSALAFVFSSAVLAQDVKPAEAPQAEAERPAMKPMQDRQIDFLRRLGLSEEQFQQIRKIRQDGKLLMEEAQTRFRDANRALNEAIYADQLNEAAVQARISDRQAAQAEVERLRFMNEFAVRRLLTQEQLIRFREMRQQFEKMRDAMEMQRRNLVDRPFSRQRRQNNADRQRNPGQPVPTTNPTDQPRQVQ